MTTHDALNLRCGDAVIYHGIRYLVRYARPERRGIRVKLIDGAHTISVRPEEIEAIR